MERAAIAGVPGELVEGRHPRTIGWLGTTALAMGGSNQSLFIIGAVLASQGTAAIPLLIVGLILAWVALPGWTELILMWPNRVGGIAASCAEAFRPYSPVLANLTGVCYWWGWVPTCGLTAILSASALHEWYLPGVSVKLMAVAIVCLLTGVNLLGIRWVTRVAVPVATASALLAGLSAFVPVLTGHVDWSRATSFTLEAPFAGLFGGITSAMAGLYLIGFAAPAFEAAACHVGETIRPNTNVPRAMYASAIMASLYFVILPVVWLGALGAGPLEGSLTSALGPTFAPLLGTSAGLAAIWFMVFNMLHGTLQPLAGASRTLMQLAEDGLLPRMLGLRLRRTDVPWVATLLTAGMSIGFLLLGDPTWLIAAANFTYLIGIGLPSVAVWLLRRHEPDRLRPYRARRGLVTLGLVAAIIWAASTVLGFQQFGLPTVIAGLALAYAGSALYALRIAGDRKRTGERMFVRSLHLKLTGAMLLVLVLDGAGYLAAVLHITKDDPALITALQDIFVAVALLTITVGLVLPGLIGHAVGQVATAADRITREGLKELIAAIDALGTGDLQRPSAPLVVEAVEVRSRDEVGAMAESFNVMQKEIARASLSLGGARENLHAATERLARLSHRNELLLDSAAEGIVGIDRNGVVVAVNPAATRLLGYDPTELIGLNFHETIHHHHPDGLPYDAVDCAIVRTLHGEQGGNVEVDDVFWRKDGTPVPVRTSVAPIVEHGVIDGGVVVMSDMSEHHRLEAQMRQAQKMDAVGRLAGGIAHDFNNLLTAISGYAALAVDRIGDDDSRLRGDIDEISRAAARASTLTQQLLAFSRKQLLQPRVLDLNHTVANVEKLLSRLLGEEVEIVVRTDSALRTTTADRGQLEQIIVNLAVNARDAMPEGGTLTITTANVTVDELTGPNPEVTPGEYVLLRVADTGTGMDAATLAQIFEPFFTTKETGKGTGLGLSTVYGIVKQSDGFVYASSVPGAGSSFEIYLPASFEPPDSEVARPDAPPARGQRERVLLVEDEPVVRTLVVDMLASQNYRVVAADDPHDALRICVDDGPFDLLITDVVMPRMRGTELAERLTELQPTLRVLFTSGYPLDGVGTAFSGDVAFLQKPFTMAELSEKVRDALEAEPPSAAPGGAPGRTPPARASAAPDG
jgi:PAS domain S-box-containing protein